MEKNLFEYIVEINENGILAKLHGYVADADYFTAKKYIKDVYENQGNCVTHVTIKDIFGKVSVHA